MKPIIGLINPSTIDLTAAPAATPTAKPTAKPITPLLSNKVYKLLPLLIHNISKNLD
jgi:hypothetical protein